MRATPTTAARGRIGLGLNRVPAGHGEEGDPDRRGPLAASERGEGRRIGPEEGSGPAGLQRRRRSWAGGWDFGLGRGRKKKKKGWAERKDAGPVWVERGGKRKRKTF